MKIKLSKKPKNCVILEGFPGFGMVGTIAAEFLIEHLKTTKIGHVLLEEEPAMVAIHKGNIIEPFSISYNEKYNLVIVHSISPSPGSEWKIADIILAMAKELNAREIISLESVNSPIPVKKPKTFFYSNNATISKKLSKMGLTQLQEGIILGVSSAILLKADKIKMSCIFAESDTGLPDSKAAAEIIKILDQYLNLDVDYKPLLDTAKIFEEKIRKILTQTKTSLENKEKKTLSYLG